MLKNCASLLLVLLMSLVFVAACTLDSQKSQFEQLSGIEQERKKIIETADPFIQSLMNKSSEMPEVRYRYSLEPDLNTQTIAVKGSLIRIGLDSVGHEVPEYSAIYLNRDKQEALGICEARSPVDCKPFGKVTVLEFKDANPLTPYDWLQGIPATAKVIGTESFNRQETTIIQYQKGDSNVKLWIQDYYLLPMKAETSHIENEDEAIDAVYLYWILQSGKIKTSEVTPSK